MSKKQSCSNCKHFNKLTTRLGRCDVHSFELTNVKLNKKVTKRPMVFKHMLCDYHEEKQQN